MSDRSWFHSVTVWGKKEKRVQSLVYSDLMIMMWSPLCLFVNICLPLGNRTTRPKDNSPHRYLALRQLAQDSIDKSPHFVILHYVWKYAGKIINRLNKPVLLTNNCLFCSCWCVKTTQFVALDGETSSHILVTSGVPQGSDLGLILFFVIH